MALSVSQPNLPTPLLLADVPVRMAKAGTRKADTDALYASLGAAVREVQHAYGLTLQEFAYELGKNERQVARWLDGSDRPQVEAVFAVDRFRAPLVIALARLSAGVEVVTEIRVRRIA